MLESIIKINQAVNGFIWGVPAMICIIGVGLLLSVRTRFIQVRKFGAALKNTIGKIFDKTQAKDGSMSPFQAVCTALAGTVGTGNIAGVAGAIALGGPGAIFWMWCSAFLGMCTKFSEVTLAIHFREKNANGEYVGGPMYYIKNGLSKKWHFLVYDQIKNNANGKVFLLKALNIPGIINRHQLELQRGMHRNHELQNDWNRYGEAAFSFDTLATLKPEDHLPEEWAGEVAELLKLWLEKLQPYGDAGYNKKKE